MGFHQCWSKTVLVAFLSTGEGFCSTWEMGWEESGWSRQIFVLLRQQLLYPSPRSITGDAFLNPSLLLPESTWWGLWRKVLKRIWTLPISAASKSFILSCQYTDSLYKFSNHPSWTLLTGDWLYLLKVSYCSHLIFLFRNMSLFGFGQLIALWPQRMS